MKPAFYLNNKNVLAQIHKSKASYCSFLDPEHHDWDVIVASVAEITPEAVAAARMKKSKPRGKPRIDIETILPESIVFRVMTAEHIPVTTEKKGRRKVGEAVRTPFPPYKHFILKDGAVIEVCRSHWMGGIENGHFSADHGRPTNALAVMWMTLVDRYGRRPNFRSYSYLDEMKGQALVQLSQVGLQFDESKSQNPFAFYTTVVRNCFVRILNDEKKTQILRDDMIEMSGGAPSFTRQFANEAKRP